ncbi:hypothetical protein [Anabaena sp. CCY 0017]|uniref:hypothetical protein n=1 Tax=Anabaena sp. CCY 0017 TaxID=3103866 RepID=UPI0039C6C7AB
MIPKPERDANGKVKGEFYPLQKAELIALHKAKLINNAAFVHLALRSENPYCDRPIEIFPQKLALRWQIPQSSVYEALAKLKDQGVISINSGKIIIEFCQQDSTIDSQQQQDSENPESIPESQKIFQNPRMDSDIPENILKFQNEFRNPRIDSDIPENQPLEPAQSKGSNFLQTIQTYSDFTDSLSEAEREEFWIFGEQKAKQLPNPPTLTRRWIEMNWQELSRQWYKSKGKTPPAQNSKWENDPRTRDWLAIIEETANPLQFIAGDSEKYEFVKWCRETKQFSWLREE